jgi:signal transduction histidine kinase
MADKPAPAILCVDDDEANRLALGMLLRHEGFQTAEATTGREALRLAGERPDLIILDVHLPDMDGFEVCRRIKAHPATSAIPVLHMSGVFVRSEDKTHGLEGGADAFLTKPVEPRELVATVRALLRMHQAEEAARVAAHQWQATFDAIHDALCLVNPQGQVLRCNLALAKLLARPAAELPGQPFAELMRTAFGEEADPLLAYKPGGMPQELALGERWLRVSIDEVRGEPSASGHVYLLADVTGRRLLEEQLRQAQKMEAVGRLAGGVAHDFNNLLTAVLGNLSLLQYSLAADDPRAELLKKTEQAAWRAAELTRQLLGFSRRAHLSPRVLDLGACVEETMALLARTLGGQIEVEVRGAEGLWPVEGDPGQMSQVLINLCLNARDAMPQGGRLTVSTANEVLTEERIRLPRAEGRGPGAGEFVRLSVRDTGRGIGPEVQARIFDPFFTTKDVWQGTGLGLAVVFGIVEEHRGWIECHSQVGAGTTFDVYLPRHPPQAKNGGTPGAANHSEGPR